MAENRNPFRRGRVRASWAILGAAMLLKTAFLGWCAWLAWYAVQVSRALGGTAYAAPPRPGAGEIFLRALGSAALLAGFTGVFALAVAALQRLIIGRRSGAIFFANPLPGWSVRSAGAAALAAFVWLFAAAVMNHTTGDPAEYTLFAELLGGAVIEVWAIATVQQRLLETVRVPGSPDVAA